MSFKERIVALVGEDVWQRLVKESEVQVARAMAMELTDEYGSEKYYRLDTPIKQFLSESEIFQNHDLKVLPIDIINVLFRCKLLFACKTEKEYGQRVGGGSYVDEFGFRVPWSEKSKDVDQLIDAYLDRLNGMIESRILISEITSFHQRPEILTEQQQFFDALFLKLGMPFHAFLDEATLVKQHEKMEPGLRSYDATEAKRFLGSPSIGFRSEGSWLYCRIYASTYLRSLFSLIRIASFILAPQRDRGWGDVTLMAPTAPFLRGQPPFRTLEMGGAFCWDEDEKESWNKIPDGCLFLSFGYRGLSKMWLDTRCFASMHEFILKNRIVLDRLDNPWRPQALYDIAPTLDILSSATQIPDFGAKILLLYCCLEHLFVPKDAKAENKKYIVGGLHALNPSLKPWFDELYDLRCNYAHKGFILVNADTMKIAADSVRNILSLLVAKLSIN